MELRKFIMVASALVMVYFTDMSHWINLETRHIAVMHSKNMVAKIIQIERLVKGSRTADGLSLVLEQFLTVLEMDIT